MIGRKLSPAKEAAKAAGEKFYVSDKACRKCGNAGRRYVSSGNCVECAVALQTVRYETKVGGVLPKRAARLARNVAPADAKTIVTGIPCLYGHIGPRRISDGSCIECGQERWEREKTAHKGPRVDARRSRREALAIGALTYDGQRCPKGHGTTRYAKSKRCVKCNSDQSVRRRERHPDKHSQYHRQYRDGHREESRKATRVWYRENKSRSHAHTRARNLRKRNAIPKWANLKAIATIYKEAASRSNAEGISFHVDHIVPLKHRLVCGLHCEDNLQVITGTENMAKKNSRWPGMP